MTTALTFSTEHVPADNSRELPFEEKRRRLVELVVKSVPSPSSQRVDRMGGEQFRDWWPVRKLAEEAVAEQLLPHSKVAEIRSVKGARVLGERVGNWLTKGQTERLLGLPDTSSLKGKRDRALLSLFVAVGLRREELASLRIEQVQVRDGRWCLVDLIGKGKRIRTVAIPDWTKEAVDQWIEAMPFRSGSVLGKVNKGGRFVGQGMTASSIYAVVLGYAEQLGIVCKPHDLRRTYGKLAHKGGAKIEQIQLSYGHASLTTTERYLGIDQDLEDAPCDHLGLTGK